MIIYLQISSKSLFQFFHCFPQTNDRRGLSVVKHVVNVGSPLSQQAQEHNGTRQLKYERQIFISELDDLQ
jgi:hypothetical protein